MSTLVLTVASAGLRVPSSTRLLADQLGEQARAALATPAVSVEVRHIEVRDHAHAIADALMTGFPSAALAGALADVGAAHALIVVTPVFQASYSGLFKSFVDLIEPDALRGMPVLLAATGGTERHSLVIEHALRPLFAHLGALSVPTGVYAATADFGGAHAPALAARIDRAAAELADLAASRLPRRATPEPRPSMPAARSGSRPPRRAGASGEDNLEVTPFAELLAAAGQG